jgi:hypothetical protein
MNRALALLTLALGCGSGHDSGTDARLPDAPLVIDAAPPALSKVDLLFVVDDSPGMLAKADLLRTRFAAFETAITQQATTLPLDYHIGVVTDDLGAAMENINMGQCHPGGDGGKLQALGTGAPPSCAGFTLSGGNFIDYDLRGATPVTNYPAAMSLTDAFTCISSVGQAGCGFEHTLEAAYRALHDTIPENAGFLRPDAVLAVVFVTDEDDCSAATDSDLFSPTAAAMANYGPDISYRCTRFGIECDAAGGGKSLPPQGASGPLTGCVPAPAAGGGKLIDISKYVTFFTSAASAGGVKADPRRVVIVGFDAPTTPFSTLLANISATAPTVPYQPCSPASLTCTAVLQHSCIASDTRYFGDPAVRLSTVISAAARAQEFSICDTDPMEGMNQLATLIAAAAIGN